jgi:hypothetical protein
MRLKTATEPATDDTKKGLNTQHANSPSEKATDGAVKLEVFADLEYSLRGTFLFPRVAGKYKNKERVQLIEVRLGRKKEEQVTQL